MWNSVLPFVLVLGALAADAVEPGELVGNARSERQLRAAIATIEQSGTELGQDMVLVGRICEAWGRFGRDDEARALLERLKGRVAEQDEPRRLCALSEVLERMGHVDDGVSAAREALDLVRAVEEPDSQTRMLEPSLVDRLARALEARGSWREAIAVHEQWHWDGFCGVGSDTEIAMRRVDIARCHVRLGEVDAAMKLLFGALTDRVGNPLPVVRELCFLGGRQRRMREVRAQVAAVDVPVELRERVESHLETGDAIAARDAAKILEIAAAAHRDNVLLRMLAREYADLGDDALEELRKRIVRGDLFAARIAHVGGIRAVRAAILSRIAMGDDRGQLRNAADALE